MPASLFPRAFPAIGVVHVAPLPGAPGAGSGATFETCLEGALRDATAYVESGFDAVIVENFGDVPFPKETVEPHVPAFLALLASAIRSRHGCPVGINVLRNGAPAALGAAAASGAAFIRVNVLVGATATDQGLIEGCADRLLRYRRSLGVPVTILADVQVKFGTPLFDPGLAELCRTTVDRGLADGVILTGAATGLPPAKADLEAARAALAGRVPVFIGSGATAANIADLATHADGVIVGSSCEHEGRAGNPVEPVRAAAFSRAVAAARSGRE